jgi:hypothetical protein
MVEEKQDYHVNRAELRGTLIQSTKGVTDKNLSFYNILIEVRGRKFTEVIPAIAYGDYKMPTVGKKVVIFGRLRSKNVQGKYMLAFLIENIDEVK